MQSQKRGAERKTKHPSDIEFTQRKIVAMQLLTTGAPKSLIRQTLQKKLGITAAQATNAIKSCEQDIVSEYESNKSFARAEVTHRLKSMLGRAAQQSVAMHASDDPVRNSELQLGWARHQLDVESHLARIEGTTTPLRIEIQAKPIAASMIEYLAALTDDEVQSLYETGIRALEDGRTITVQAETNGVAGGQTH